MDRMDRTHGMDGCHRTDRDHRTDGLDGIHGTDGRHRTDGTDRTDRTAGDSQHRLRVCEHYDGGRDDRKQHGNDNDPLYASVLDFGL
jgi:hypothetical protein